MTYRAVLAPAARRAMSQRLPQKIALAVAAFIEGPLLENPRRVSKELDEPFKGHRSARRGPYRIVFLIDDERQLITVVDIAYHDDIYRPR